MDSYDFIKSIGRGNFGVVNLVQSNVDSKRYVLKVINLSELSKSEREGALQEVKPQLIELFLAFSQWVCCIIYTHLFP